MKEMFKIISRWLFWQNVQLRIFIVSLFLLLDYRWEKKRREFHKRLAHFGFESILTFY